MNKSILYTIVLMAFALSQIGCELEQDTFLLDVANYTSDEVILWVNGQTFDRVKPGERKLCDDEFEYNTLFHFLAVSINNGEVMGEIFVTANDIEYYPWIID